ncbi:MAG: hypothetical protein P1V97_15940 [Planctomycetota bacterium]|nr:hypothetical protein [Planctomycetota bacterium]
MVSASMNAQASQQVNHHVANLAVELQVLERPLADKVLAFLNSQPTPMGFVDYLTQSGRFAPDSLEKLQQEWVRRNPPQSPNVPPMAPSSSQFPIPSIPTNSPSSSTHPAVGSRAPHNGAPPPSQSGTFRPHESNGMTSSSGAFSANTTSSNTPASLKADELLAFLLGKNWKLVPMNQLVECRAMQAPTGCRLGAILIGKNLITSEHLAHACENVYRIFAICSLCAQTHDLRNSTPAACPSCQGPWFQDSVEKMLTAPTALPTPPPPSVGVAGQSFVPPPPMAPNNAPPPPINPNQAFPNPGATPPAPAPDLNDPFNMPVGYQEQNSQAKFSELLATSSINRNRSRKFVPPKPPEPSPESSDEINLGHSFDELSIFPGASSDEFTAPPEVAAATAPAAGAKVEPVVPATAPPPQTVGKANKGKAKGKKKDSPKAKKKGCFGKSAAAIILLATILVPVIAYAW